MDLNEVAQKAGRKSHHRPPPPNGFYVSGAWTKSGLATTVLVRNRELKMNLAFDLGFFSEKVLLADKVFVSHGHTDHIGAIFQHARGRNMMSRSPPTYYVPPSTLCTFQKMKEAVEELDGGGEIPCTFVPVSPGDEIDIGRGCRAKVFQTEHRVPSQGYAILHRKAKGLKDEYQGLKGEQLKNLKASGVEIVNIVETTEVVFTGDTTISPLIDLDFVWNAKLLLIEATYLECGNPKEQESAQRWQHIHLEDILSLQEKMNNEQVVLFHLSAKYQNLEQVKKTLATNIPNEFANQYYAALHLFGSKDHISSLKDIIEEFQDNDSLEHNTIKEETIM